MNEVDKKGLLATFSCCFIWGLLPLYWALLHHLSSLNVLSHRIIWSGVAMGLLIILTNRQQFITDLRHLREHRNQLLYLLGAAVLIGVNWFAYIWAVTNDHVMDSSLGYYINPLLNVLLGVVLYKETLSWPKQLSVLIAAIGIGIMTYQMGSLPFVSIFLAVTFSLYGATKKRLTIHPFTSIAFEAWLTTPFALLYTTMYDAISWSYFDSISSTTLLLMGAGLTTSLPLVLFAYGAQRLPMNILGFTQYISPTIAFFLAVFYFGESFDTPQMIAFGCIWVALVIFTMSNRLNSKA